MTPETYIALGAFVGYVFAWVLRRLEQRRFDRFVLAIVEAVDRGEARLAREMLSRLVGEFASDARRASTIAGVLNLVALGLTLEDASPRSR